MRGSVAESRSNVNNYKAEGGARASGGYTLRPSGQADTTPSGSRRPASRSGELRLGKLQVVVWLGLALGSIVGAYFVGFFSGRYVGFESARESSAGEVAKLPAPESFQGAAGQNPGGVYDKLKAPAVMREPEEEGQAPQGRPIIKGSQAAEVAAGTVRLEDDKKELAGSDGVGGALQGNVSDEGLEASGLEEQEASESEIENVIAEQNSGPQVIIGSDEGLGAAKVPDSVRLLGSTPKTDTAKVDTAKDAQAKVVAPTKSEKSATNLLDERIAKARSDAAKPASTSVSTTKTSGRDSGPLVRKVLPSGYFAQVAAPKKVSEAEAIAAKLKRSGFPVVVESASVAGQGFYRVMVGPEQNKVQADRLVTQLKSEKYISGKPFIRKVK
jgi:cell division protein FtsN